LSHIAASSPNFGFLVAKLPALASIGALAERNFGDDPNTTLVKLRQFGEVLARLVAARNDLPDLPEDAQFDLLKRLQVCGAIPGKTVKLFHHLRVAGNEATHHGSDDPERALVGLKFARQLGLWFLRAYMDEPKAVIGPFVPPMAPPVESSALKDELDRLRKRHAASLTELERQALRAQSAEKARLSAEDVARREAEERRVWEAFAVEIEAEKNRLLEQLRATRYVSAISYYKISLDGAPGHTEQFKFFAAASAAAQQIHLDEFDQRYLIED
jgi:type I restriction enzyme R subunit